jgi:hypothetical protein
MEPTVMTRFTVELPDEVAEGLALMAASRGRNPFEMAADILLTFMSQSATRDELDSMKRLSDEEVIEMADLRLDSEEDARLAELLELNGEGALTSEQEKELEQLMRIQNDALLRKSIGLAEAVRRKLREPMSP